MQVLLWVQAAHVCRVKVRVRVGVRVRIRVGVRVRIRGVVPPGTGPVGF